MSTPRQSITHQFDLFSTTHRGTTAGTPQWPELPEETRQDAIEEALLDVVEPGAIAPAIEAERNVASQRDQV
jgi:hypothetical protein